MFHFMRLGLILALSAFLSDSLSLQAQVSTPLAEPDFAVDATSRTEIIDGLIKALKDGYIFPEVAKKMEDSLKKHKENKDYDSLASAASLCKKLQGDLREICHDKHLSVHYSLEKLPSFDHKDPTADERAKRREQVRRQGMHGFKKLEILDGNVGYLRFDGFAPPEFAAEIATAAMNFVADTNALIIDLRENHGGSPAMVAFLCSYLFDTEEHLNDLYFRPDGRTRQWWTLPAVPGKRYVGKEVYLLTSKETFSAAEEFTYNLKNLKRARLVGETTGGGAHPVGAHRINDHFYVIVPQARAINPITKTNWEGTGVKPDLEVPASRAFHTAYVEILKKAVTESKDKEESVELKKILEKAENEATSKKD